MTDFPIPLPDNEFERLLALAHYEVLDSLPETAFDRVTALVAETLGFPAVRVNFVDQRRVWTKSRVGPEPDNDQRAGSLCAWTLMSPGVSVVPDMSVDPRFAPQGPVRMYAGAPLVTPQGQAIGTLCVGSDQPGQPGDFGAREQRLLQMFAALVMDELELRLHTIELGRQVRAQDSRQQELRRTLHHAETLMDITRQFAGQVMPPEAARHAAALLGQAVDAEWCGLIEVQPRKLVLRLAWQHPELPPDVVTALTLAGQDRSWMPEVLSHRAGLYIDDYAAWPGALGPLLAAGVAALTVRPLGAFGDTDYLLMALRVGAARPWSGSDRALIEAAAGSVEAALYQSNRLRQVEQAASTDSLTGLGNRRAYDESVAGESVAGRRQEIGQVAFIDLDGMKVFNDHEGHARGDELLALFGHTLRAELRAPVQLFRIGGDEFAVLVPARLVPPDGCGARLAETVERVMAHLRASGFGEIHASVGVADVTAGDVDAVLRWADTRMYEQKRRRRAERAAATVNTV